jgi:predicted GIY-YIG superfamily endonuclease
MSARDTYRYVLRDGRKVVQFGISDDPEARVQEHRGDGKRFKTMTVVGPAVTRDSALDWERDRIETYRRSHNGRMPRYNKI